MSFYPRLAASATRLVNKYGRDIIVRTTVSYGPDYDPVHVPEDTTIKAVVASHEARSINGTTILATDQLLIAAATIDLAPGMTVIDDGDTYQIVQPVERVKPGPTTVLWLANIRRS